MSTIEKDTAARLRDARKAMDGAMSRDRGRLLGLWSRWQGKPADAAAEAAFAQLLAQSLEQRQQRAAQALQVTLDEALPIAREAAHITNLRDDSGSKGISDTGHIPYNSIFGQGHCKKLHLC